MEDLNTEWFLEYASLAEPCDLVDGGIWHDLTAYPQTPVGVSETVQTRAEVVNVESMILGILFLDLAD